MTSNEISSINRNVAPKTTTITTETVVFDLVQIVKANDTIDATKIILYILNALGFIFHLFILFYLIANYIKCKTVKKDKKKTNFVTIAFIGHQSLIDTMRILYCVYYVNTIINAQQLDNVILSATALSNMPDYTYALKMSSFYSVLTMVTLINLLTIFICETCRFYDLKLNSNDSSNIYCLLFGVMLIWLSSFIIISSIMLISISSASAPTYFLSNELRNPLTRTRILVINFVWFGIVTFIITISVLYTRSLNKELSSLDYKHHRISIYALYAPVFSKNKYKDEKFRRRHNNIVRQTSKRLALLFFILIIFSLQWFPNFFCIILELFYSQFKRLRSATTIFWLLNPVCNSFVFLNLLVQEFKRKYRLPNVYTEHHQYEQQLESIEKTFNNKRSKGDTKKSKFALCNCWSLFLNSRKQERQRVLSIKKEADDLEHTIGDRLKNNHCSELMLNFKEDPIASDVV